MKNNRKLFIRFLKEHINKEHSVLNEILTEDDWDEIQKYAQSHQVEGIIYYQTKNNRFLPSFSASIYRYTNRVAVLEKIVSDFDRPLAFVKGPEVAKKYPVPALRTMGDVDIIVHPEDKQLLHEYMINLGYCCNQTDREWIYSKDYNYFEVHDCLVYSIQRKTDEQEIFFNNCWIYRDGTSFNWNFHLMFLVFHLRKHFLNQGVGFRQFLDIAAVVKSCDDLDWRWIEDRFREIGLLRFASIVFALCNRWFDSDIHITCELSEEFIENTTEIIFDNGVFGFSNKENQKNVVVNRMKENGKIGMINQFIYDLFLPLDKMKEIADYSFLKKQKYLLPYAWCKRIFVNLKESNLDKLRTHYFISFKEFQKREEYLKFWGIE